MLAIEEEDGIILTVNYLESGLTDDFTFEIAMRLLPLEQQADILKKRQKTDQIKTLCNRVLQLYGAFMATRVKSASSLRFGRGKFGKPMIDVTSITKLGNKSSVSFSMSNGESHICMYLRTSPSPDPVQVGIDIASINDLTNVNELELYKDIFTTEEFDQLVRTPDSHKQQLFAHYWSLKESYTKYLGTGLNIDLKVVDLKSINRETDIDKYINRHIQKKNIMFFTHWLEYADEVISICCDKSTKNPPRFCNIPFQKILDTLTSL